MTTYTQARQAEQENAERVRKLSEESEKALNALRLDRSAETFQEFKTRKASAEYKRAESVYIKLADEKYRAEIAQHFYKNNTRVAFVNDYRAEIAGTLQRYAGKAYGERTREKIADEFNAKTGARLYISERALTCYPSARAYNWNIEIYAQQDGAPLSSFLIDNKIQAHPAEILRGAHIGEFCEDIPASVDYLIKTRAEIIAKAQELKTLCDEYNAHTVGNLPRLVNYSRYWSADVLREETR